MAEPITREAHYVPQATLKRWSQDGIHVSAYRLLISHPNVTRMAESPHPGLTRQRDLYTFEGDTKGDDFEKFITREIEEPSAGTGALLDAARSYGGETVAVELNRKLCQLLRQRFPNVIAADFLECGEELDKFDRIIMNPSFAGQADIDHVNHALTFLKPGGRLVAIMLAGVAYRDKKAATLRAHVESIGGSIEPLPPDSFKY